jgi:hypothetical protein
VGLVSSEKERKVSGGWGPGRRVDTPVAMGEDGGGAGIGGC